MRDTKLQELGNRQLAVYVVDVADNPRRSLVRLAHGHKIMSALTDEEPVALHRKPSNETSRKEALGASRRRLLDAFGNGKSHQPQDSVNFVVGPAELQRIRHLDHAELMLVAMALGYGKFTRIGFDPLGARYGFTVAGSRHPLVVFIDRSGEAEALSVVNMNPDPYLEKEESMAFDHVVLCLGTILEWQGQVSQEMVDLAFEPWQIETSGIEERADRLAKQRKKRENALARLFLSGTGAQLEDPIIGYCEADLRCEAVGAPATFRRGSLEEMRLLMRSLRLHEIACEQYRIEALTGGTIEQVVEIREYKADRARHLDWRCPPHMFVSTAYGSEKAFHCPGRKMLDAHIEIGAMIVDYFNPSSSAPRYITSNRASGIKPGSGYLEFTWSAAELLDVSGHERLDAEVRLSSFLKGQGLRPSMIEQLLDLRQARGS